MELSSYSSSYGDEAASIISDQKSCEFSNHSSTCIKKAKINLFLLQNRINEWQSEINKYNKALQGMYSVYCNLIIYILYALFFEA